MTSVPRRRQSLVAWPGAAKLLIRCLSLNAFSGVSPHPHASQVGFESRASWARAHLLPFPAVPLTSSQTKEKKASRQLILREARKKKRKCREQSLPIVVATIRLRTTHCVSAARSPPDHLSRHFRLRTRFTNPLAENCRSTD